MNHPRLNMVFEFYLRLNSAKFITCASQSTADHAIRSLFLAPAYILMNTLGEGHAMGQFKVRFANEAVVQSHPVETRPNHPFSCFNDRKARHPIADGMTIAKPVCS